jgi:hypothetical protein
VLDGLGVDLNISYHMIIYYSFGNINKFNYFSSLGAGDSGVNLSTGEFKSGRRETMASLSLKQWETMLVVFS